MLFKTSQYKIWYVLLGASGLYRFFQNFTDLLRDAYVRNGLEGLYLYKHHEYCHYLISNIIRLWLCLSRMIIAKDMDNFIFLVSISHYEREYRKPSSSYVCLLFYPLNRCLWLIYDLFCDTTSCLWCRWLVRSWIFVDDGGNEESGWGSDGGGLATRVTARRSSALALT
jgi:hypothetical protein